MAFLRDLEPDLANRLRERLLKASDESVSLHMRSYELLLRFVILVNGGGAIAALGFIGAAQSLGERAWAAAACVVAFAVGIVVAGIFVWRAERDLHQRVRYQTEAARQVLGNKQEIEVVVDGLSQSRPRLRSNQLFWGSFLPFVAGLIFGVLAVLPKSLSL